MPVRFVVRTVSYGIMPKAACSFRSSVSAHSFEFLLMVSPEKASRSTDETVIQSSLSAETSDAGWEILASHLEAFLEEWDTSGYGPRLADHLPKEPPAFRRMVLVELIKVDLEYRYNADGPVLKLEDYLDEYPELGRPDGVPVELIHEEYHVRKTSGQTVSVEDCLERFPDRTESIRRAFQMEGPEESTSATGAELTESFRPGDRIEDFYLMSNLGSGAFGSVFLARQESMQRMVALKVSSDKGTEGQTLAQLDHPNIVRVYDQVRLPDRNLRLLYMQFAAGGTLQAVVKAAGQAKHKSGRIVMQCIADALDHTGVLSSENIPFRGGLADASWPQVVCQLGVELARALQYAHSRNTLHRDVKPANVLLDANGTAKLADFNISFGAEIEGDSAAASFGGSLAYMSPEQLQACHIKMEMSPDDLDERSDIYSLGVMLWELMYGERPFDDSSVTGGWTEVLEGMIAGRTDGVSRQMPDSAGPVEHRLWTILCRCLQFDRNNRCSSADELAHELGLSMQPRVAQLMQQSSTGWRKLALAWPLTAFLITAIAPHAFAAVFNYAYNDVAIAQELKTAFTDRKESMNAEQAFTRMVIGVNAIAFPIGFAFCIWYSRPVVQVIRGFSEEASAATARLRSFLLSRFVTILGITEWMIAGLAYPIGLHIILGELDMKWHLHFFGSLLICGLIAAAYPFFLTATLCLRAFLPALLRNDRLNTDDVSHLQRLSEQSAWSLYLAGGVPAVGMMILLTTQEAADPLTAFPLKVLSVAGAVGFAVALSLARSLQSDVEAFLDVYRRQTDSQQ